MGPGEHPTDENETNFEDLIAKLRGDDSALRRFNFLWNSTSSKDAKFKILMKMRDYINNDDNKG